MTPLTEWARRAAVNRCPWCGCAISPSARSCRSHADLERQREREQRDRAGVELEQAARELERGAGG